MQWIAALSWCYAWREVRAHGVRSRVGRVSMSSVSKCFIFRRQPQQARGESLLILMPDEQPHGLIVHLQRAEHIAVKRARMQENKMLLIPQRMARAMQTHPHGPGHSSLTALLNGRSSKHRNADAGYAWKMASESTALLQVRAARPTDGARKAWHHD